MPPQPQASAPSTGAAALQYTVFSATVPACLTKILTLTSEGTLHKESAANMQRGTAQRSRAHGLQALADALEALNPAQAISWGVCNLARAEIVPERDTAQTPGSISRTRRHFSYPAGPGVMMLDHDGLRDGTLSAEQLRDRLIEACPALANAPMLWRPSCSAGVQTADGRELTPLSRHRLYIPVKDASRIPEAGKALAQLLWAAGHGWYEVGRAGQLLDRTLIDASVWQPERLDFCAPPELGPGLQRPHTAPRIFGDALALFDLAQIALDADREKQAKALKKDTRASTAGLCAAQRDRWVQEHAPALAKRRGIPLDKARDVLHRACAPQQRALMGDFVLTSEQGKPVSVGEILDHPDRWHNAQFADPLDPDEDTRVAVVNLKSGQRPYLYTHRHGGLRFELLRQSARIQIGRGMRVSTTDSVLTVLQERGELYDYGEGAVVYVAGGKIHAVSADWLTDHMGRVCEFYRVRLRRKADGEEATEESPEDAPKDVASIILAKHGQRGFKNLVAVVTAPTLRLDGSILDKPGHDESTGLLYYSEHPNPPRVPAKPSAQDALQALRTLWEPFRLFPLKDGVDNACLLHGLLSATLRASLPTAPGVGFDAPAAGSGKTLLARCIGILATGADPTVYPPADTDEETRKRLFAALREGQRVVLWDNVRATLGSASLDAFLTAPSFSDRLLGSSETVTLPNRALFIATGNNLQMTSDTCRRMLTARIDAESERPYTRDFAFDPAQILQAGRVDYVVAALTIVRAYIAAGRPKAAKGRTASFEHWDDLVRQPICWLAGQVAQAHEHGAGEGLPVLADPVKAFERAFENDPETNKLGALLEAWHAAFEDAPTTTGEAERAGYTNALLLSAMLEIAGQNGKVNTGSMGRKLQQLQGRYVAGKRFVRVGKRNGLLHWAVHTKGGDAWRASTTPRRQAGRCAWH